MSVNKKKIIIPIVAVVIIGGLLTFYFLTRNTFAYAGTVEATIVDLSSRLPANIASVFVQEGDGIKRDQVLVELSCEDVRVTQEFALTNYARAQKLLKAGSISQEVYDNASNRRDEINTRVSWCKILSPIDGTVMTRYMEPGEWANPGTKILSVANLKDIFVYIYVPQDEMSRLKVGQKFEGLVPELKKKFPAQIIKINDEAEFTPKNVQTRSERTRLIFGIKLALSDESGQLKPGMTIEFEL